MLERNQGMTAIQNQLKSSEVVERGICELRDLHVAMDKEVLEAYGWSDLVPPSVTAPRTEKEQLSVQLFDDEVIDRLLSLNAQRASEERALGQTNSKRKSTKSPTKKTSKKQLTFKGSPVEEDES